MVSRATNVYRNTSTVLTELRWFPDLKTQFYTRRAKLESPNNFFDCSARSNPTSFLLRVNLTVWWDISWDWLNHCIIWQGIMQNDAARNQNSGCINASSGTTQLQMSCVLEWEGRGRWPRRFWAHVWTSPEIADSIARASIMARWASFERWGSERDTAQSSSLPLRDIVKYKVVHPLQVV